MTATPTHRARRFGIGLVTFALAAAGLSVAAEPASAAAAATFTATVSSPATGDATKSTTFPLTPTTASFAVTNQTTSNIYGLQIQLPAGLTAVTIPSLPGWSTSQGGCLPSFTGSCARYLTGSPLAPGKSVNLPLSFTTPATAAPLTFTLSGLGLTTFTVFGGITASIKVVTSKPDAWCVTGPTPTPVVAGAAESFTAQAVVKGSSASTNPCDWATSGYAGGTLVPSFGVADPQGTPGAARTVTASSAGTFTFSATFGTAVAGQSFVVTESSPGTASGTSGTFTVGNAAGATLFLGSLVDTTQDGRFAAGDFVTADVTVQDQFHNTLALATGDITVAPTAGAGAFTPTKTLVDNAVRITFQYKKADTLSFTAAYGAGTGNLVKTANQKYSPGAPTHLTVTNVLDVQNPGKFFQADVVDIAFQVTDDYTNVIPVPDAQTSVTVGVTNGTGTFTRSATGAPPDSTGTSHLYGSYSAVGTPTLTLTYGTASGATSQAFVATVAAGSAVLTPGVNAQVNALTVVPGPGGTSSCSTPDPCANGNFPAGANGLATMTVDGPNSAVNLTANLKDKAGLPLYSGAKPASLTYLCPLGRCPLNLAFRGFGGISANDDLLPSTAVVGAKCSNNGIVLQDVAAGAGGKKYCVYNAWEESVELAQSYRLTVAFPTTANPNPAPVQVEACQVYKGSSLISKLSPGSALASVKTVPTGTQACLDVTSVTRSADGTVAFPVYYWNDIIIKAR